MLCTLSTKIYIVLHCTGFQRNRSESSQSLMSELLTDHLARTSGANHRLGRTYPCDRRHSPPPLCLSPSARKLSSWLRLILTTQATTEEY